MDSSRLKFFTGTNGGFLSTSYLLKSFLMNLLVKKLVVKDFEKFQDLGVIERLLYD